MKHVCRTCGYETNRLWSFNDHMSRQSACEKRIKRLHNEATINNVGDFVNNVGGRVNNVGDRVNNVGDRVNNVGDSINDKNTKCISTNNCNMCKKSFSTYNYLLKHQKKCKGMKDPLQCPTCKKIFSSRYTKYEHMKNVKCELVLTEEQQRIKELEELLEEEKEKSKEKEKQLEEARARPTTVYNTTNNICNNYFNPDIKYNDYDKLSTEHITNEQIHHMYIENRRYFPDVSEAVSRDLFRIEENRCIYVPEGQKGSYGIVYKDGKYIRKPITHIFATVCDTGARHMFESGAIPEKDYGDDNSVTFWNDMSRAIGLQKTDYDDLSQFDKDLITRQKYVGLDVQDEKEELSQQISNMSTL